MAQIIGLDTEITPVEHAQTFDIIPEGYYAVEVVSIADWKPTVYKRIALSEFGVKTGEVLEDATVYNAQAKLKIIDGDYAGRNLWYNLTTHPNAAFIIENFTYAIDVKCNLKDLQKEAVGKQIEAYVIETTYNKKNSDKDTGIETTIAVPKNEIKTVRRLKFPIAQENNSEDKDKVPPLDISSDDLPF